MSTLLKDAVARSHSQETLFAKAVGRLTQSPLREILPRASQPGVISLALGMPASELFPKEKFTQAVAQAFSATDSTLYSEPYQSLKNHIVKLMHQRGVRCTADQIFLTAGAQQGLDLISQLLVDPRDDVIVEDTIYDGLKMVLQNCDANVLAVPTSLGSGMDLDAVEALLEGGHRPAFLYCITEGHNPLGVSMSPTNRRRLIELARHWKVPILEDDAYGLLYYDGVSPPDPLRAMDEQWVFYLGSFSKILAPALRVGWIVVPGKLTYKVEQIVSRLSVLKQAADFDTATLAQRIVSAYLDTGDLPHHLRSVRKEYKSRRDAMTQALDEYFPHEIHWNRPASGLFLWIEMPPETLDAYQLLQTAIDTEKVAFLPGQAFAIDSKRQWSTHCMRLSFGSSKATVIVEAIARLSRVVKAALAELRCRPQIWASANERIPARQPARFAER